VEAYYLRDDDGGHPFNVNQPTVQAYLSLPADRYMDALEAENAELRKAANNAQKAADSMFDAYKTMGLAWGECNDQLTTARELLRDARKANAENWVDIDDFLSKMEDTHE